MALTLRGARLAAVLSLLLLLCTCDTDTDMPAEAALLYMSKGRVVAVDPVTLAVSVHGAFAPDAPTVERDAQGLLWAKMAPNRLAALDPRTNQIVASVPLRYRPFDHVLMPNGRAYVTHNTVTPSGFTMSVVDTAARKLVKEIDGIGGLRTDLVHDDRFVYLATVGVTGADNLLPRLYRIDSATDTLEELRASREAGFHWKLAVSPSALYLCSLPNKGSAFRARIEVLDPATLRVRRTVALADLAGEGLELTAMLAGAGRTVLVCGGNGAGFEAVVTTAELALPARRFVLQGVVKRVLGEAGGMLVYADETVAAGTLDVSLRCYDIEGGKEVKRRSISRLLEGG